TVRSLRGNPYRRTSPVTAAFLAKVSSTLFQSTSAASADVTNRRAMLKAKSGEACFMIEGLLVDDSNQERPLAPYVPLVLSIFCGSASCRPHIQPCKPPRSDSANRRHCSRDMFCSSPPFGRAPDCQSKKKKPAATLRS